MADRDHRRPVRGDRFAHRGVPGVEERLVGRIDLARGDHLPSQPGGKVTRHQFSGGG
jgi:hypothetical protein